MARMNHSNARIRNTVGEIRLNSRLDDTTEKGQKEFTRQYNARQRTAHENEAELNKAQCNKCGGNKIVAVIGSGPHAYKWICGTCGFHIKWTSNPLSENILENPKSIAGKN